MEEFISGCIGGAIGTTMVYPFDTWRVRKQSNITSRGNIYSGVLSPLIGIGLEKSIVFGSYGITKKYMPNEFSAGLLSGFLASIVVTPIEKWKILKQNNPSLSYKQIIPGTIKKGIFPLYNGLSACFMREIPGYAIYFHTYYNLLKYKPLEYVSCYNQTLSTFLYGGLSGVSAWVFIYPFDTIKTNMQYKNTSFIDTTKMLIDTRKLYSGFRFGITRAFLLHSFVFLGYETMLSMIR